VIVDYATSRACRSWFTPKRIAAIVLGTLAIWFLASFRIFVFDTVTGTEKVSRHYMKFVPPWSDYSGDDEEAVLVLPSSFAYKEWRAFGLIFDRSLGPGSSISIDRVCFPMQTAPATRPAPAD